MDVTFCRYRAASACTPPAFAALFSGQIGDPLFWWILKACFFRGFCKPHFSRRLQALFFPRDCDPSFSRRLQVLYFPIDCEPSFSRRFPTPAFPRSLHRPYWGDDPGHLHLPANLHHAPL